MLMASINHDGHVFVRRQGWVRLDDVERVAGVERARNLL